MTWPLTHGAGAGAPAAMRFRADRSHSDPGSGSDSDPQLLCDSVQRPVASVAPLPGGHSMFNAFGPVRRACFGVRTRATSMFHGFGPVRRACFGVRTRATSMFRGSKPCDVRVPGFRPVRRRPLKLCTFILIIFLNFGHKPTIFVRIWPRVPWVAIHATRVFRGLNPRDEYVPWVAIHATCVFRGLNPCDEYVPGFEPVRRACSMILTRATVDKRLQTVAFQKYFLLINLHVDHGVARYVFARAFCEKRCTTTKREPMEASIGQGQS